MSIKATRTAQRSVTYLNDDGSSEIREGGNWTWRNQSGVRKNKKGTIVSYRVEGFGRFDKLKAISLVGSGMVDRLIQ